MAKAGLQASDFGKTLNTVDDAMDIMSNNTLKGTKSIKAFGKGLLDGAKKTAKFIGLKGLGIGALIAGAGIALKKVYDDMPSSHAKRLNEMTQEYQINQDELASINSELADTQARIEELNLKENLTLVEEDELHKLERTNSELERQKVLKESQNRVDTREKLNEAKDTYESYVKDKLDDKVDRSINANKITKNKNEVLSTDGQDNHGGSYMGTIKVNQNDIKTKKGISALSDKIDVKKDDINFVIGAYQALMESENELAQEISLDKLKLKGLKGKDAEEANKKIQDKEKVIAENQVAQNQAYGYINDYYQMLDQTYQAYQDAKDIGIITPKELENMNEIEATLDDYYKVMDQSGKSIESKIATQFAKKEYADLEKQMIEAGKEGSESLDALIAKNQRFTNDLSKVGVSADELKQHIMAIADPDAYKMDKLRETLRDKFMGDEPLSYGIDKSKSSIWDKFISGKSDEDMKTFYDYIKEQEIDLSELDYGDLEYNFTIAVEGEEEAKSAALTIDQLNEKVGKYQTNLSAVSTALSETESATGLTPESIQGLSDAFGTLEGYDPSGLFINTAKGVKVNDKALKRLVKTQHEASVSDLDQRIAKQTEELKKQQEILNNDEASAGQLKAAEENFKKAQENIENMKRAQAQLSAIYNEQMKQFSDFQNIQNAKITPNAGDEYTSVMQDIQAAKEAWDKGFIGTDDFKSVAKYLSPYGFDNPVNFKENFDRISKYFTEDGSGVFKFYEDMESRGLATLKTLSDGTQEWVTNFTDAEEAALAMGMGYEPFMAIFGRAQDMGAFNSFASSAEEASQNVDEISSKLAQAISKKAELEAKGAPQYAIDAQQAEVDKYTAQLDEVQKTEQEFNTNIGAKRAEEIREARKQIELLGKEYEKLVDQGDIEAANQIGDEIKSLAEAHGLEYDDNYVVDESGYLKALQATGAATWEIPKSAKEMGFKEGTDEANNYENALNALTAAHDQNNEATESALNTLSSYNTEQLKGIKLGDGVYNVEGMEAAEDALEDLAEATGLTMDGLMLALEGVGILKPEVDTTDLTELNDKATSSQDKLNEINGSTYTFDFETNDLDTIEDQVQKATEQIEPYLTTGSDGTPKYDYTKEGAQEAADVYQAAIAQQQRAEYENSAAYQSEATTPLAEATKNWLEAKAEFDTQAELASKGMKNNMEEAQKQAKSTFETLKKADTEGVFDTSSMDNAEKDLLDDTSEEYEIKVGADTSEAQSEIDKVKQEEITTKINTVIEDGGQTVNELLAMSDQELMTTIGCDASEIDMVRDQLESMDNQNVQFAVEIDNTQFNALIEAITGEPVTQEVEIKPEVDETGLSVLQQEFGNEEIVKTISVQGNLAEQETILAKLTNAPKQMIIEMIQRGMTPGEIIASIQKDVTIPTTYEQPDPLPDPEPKTQKVDIEAVGADSLSSEIENATSQKEVELVGNVVSLDITGDYPSVALEGKITNIDTTGNYQSVALKGNIVQVVGTDGKQVTIDAIANIMDTQGADGQQANIEAIANIIDVLGEDGQNVVINAIANISGVNDSSATVVANVSGTAEVEALKAAIHTLKGKTVTAKAKVSGTSEVNALKSAIDALYGKFVSVGASVSGTGAVDALRSSIAALQDRTVTVTTNHVSRSSSEATGTATSIAHTDGTAHNVINMRPLSSAHARGDISLNNDEKALVNEVGMNMPLYLFNLI